MRKVVPGGDKYASIQSRLRELKLNTLCEEAKWPNIGECRTGGESGTNSYHHDSGGYPLHTRLPECVPAQHRSESILLFCAVKTSLSPPLADPVELSRVAEAVVVWGLNYVFDSPGNPRVTTSRLDVLTHHIETVEEIQSSVRDRWANFKQNPWLYCAWAISSHLHALTKTSIMVVKTMKSVRDAVGADARRRDSDQFDATKRIYQSGSMNNTLPEEAFKGIFLCRLYLHNADRRRRFASPLETARESELFGWPAQIEAIMRSCCQIDQILDLQAFSQAKSWRFQGRQQSCFHF
uniref:Uncharacterized protein n=1 Tax=Physcomitrium patens TaxID=3218 RepID=A0A2K1KMU4_PHYPA|nr:hypothetical protein PHYPA_005993 [Physcomitrium patens]